ncbi:MAG: type II toxin-antitoxin system HicA family toxin [Candidatus Izimaplasma sp.]|nr:type II toxin-antitoxin system HicA family toxin [Candidatus Izimaplasma bacterium]
MSKTDKLIEKLLTIPNDLRYNEFKRILESLGYEEYNKGKTSGSRVTFYRTSDSDKISGDRPHGNKPVSIGWIKRVVKHLKNKGDI